MERRFVKINFLCYIVLYLNFYFCEKCCYAKSITVPSKEVYVLRYFEGKKIVPIAVEIDLKHQTELVISLRPNKRREPLTFYDFLQRKVAHKDHDNRKCFIGDMGRETLEGDRRRLTQLKNRIVKEFYIPTLIIHRGIKNKSEVREQFGDPINSFCDGSSVFYVTSHARSRKRRGTTSSGTADGSGQFTHHSYGHYGHQTNNYAHYGHETYMKGAVDRGGIVRDGQIRQNQIRAQGSQSYPSLPRTSNVQAPPSNGQLSNRNVSNINIPFQSNVPGRNFGAASSGQFSFETAQDSGYQLNLPFGLTAGNSYRGGVHSQGQYGVSDPQPQIHADSRRIPIPGTERTYRPPSTLQTGHSAIDSQGRQQEISHTRPSSVSRDRDEFISPGQLQGVGGHRTDGLIVPDLRSMDTITGGRRESGIITAGPQKTGVTASRGHRRGEYLPTGLLQTRDTKIIDSGGHQFLIPDTSQPTISTVFEHDRDRAAYPSLSTTGHRTKSDKRRDSLSSFGPSQTFEDRSSSAMGTPGVPQIRHQTVESQRRYGYQRRDGYTAPDLVRTDTLADDRRIDGFVSPDHSQTVYPTSLDQPRNEFRLPGFSHTGQPVTIDRSRFVPTGFSQTGDSQYGDTRRDVLQYPAVSESSQTADDYRREGTFYAAYPTTQEIKPGSILPGTSQTVYPVPTDGDYSKRRLSPGILQTRGGDTGLTTSQVPGGLELTRPVNMQTLPEQSTYLSSQTQVGDSVKYSKADSAFSQTQIQANVEGTAAEASSAGQRRGHGSQTQVQGSHTGNGSFSAEAQSGFTGGAIQSQVLGNSQGGMSGSSALVEQVGSAQSQVQIGQPSGSASSSAQGRFSSGMTQVRTQTGTTGGSAGAESQSSGLSSSQVQVNINREGGSPGTGFHGKVSASVRGGQSSGQSQTQIQGGYGSGSTYAATAQGGFDSTLVLKPSGTTFGSLPALISPMGGPSSELHPTSRVSGLTRQLQRSGENSAQQIVPGGVGTFTPAITDFGRDTSRRGTNLEQVESSRISNGQTFYAPSRHHILPLRPEHQHHTSSKVQPQSHVAANILTNAQNMPLGPETLQPDHQLRYIPPPPNVPSEIPSHVSAGKRDFSQPNSVLRAHENQPTYIQPRPQVSREETSKTPRSTYISPPRPRSQQPRITAQANGISHSSISQPDVYGSGFQLNQHQTLSQVPADLPLYIPGGSQVQQPGHQPRNIDTQSRVQTGFPSFEQGRSQISSIRPGLQPPELQPSHIQAPIQVPIGLPSHFTGGLIPALQYPAPQSSHTRFPIQVPISFPGQHIPPEVPKSLGFQPSHYEQPSTHISPPRTDRAQEVPNSPDLGYQPGDYQQPSTHTPPRPQDIPKSQDHRFQPGQYQQPTMRISPTRPDSPQDVPKSPVVVVPPGHYQHPSMHISPPQPDRPSTSVVSRPSKPGNSGQQRPGPREPDQGSCCDALRSLKRRCCGRSEKPTSSCCSRKSHFEDDFDLDDGSDESTTAEPCKVVKAICYIVYKPVGKARICKPTSTTSSRC